MILHLNLLYYVGVFFCLLFTVNNTFCNIADDHIKIDFIYDSLQVLLPLPVLVFITNLSYEHSFSFLLILPLLVKATERVDILVYCIRMIPEFAAIVSVVQEIEKHILFAVFLFRSTAFCFNYNLLN